MVKREKKKEGSVVREDRVTAVVAAEEWTRMTQVEEEGRDAPRQVDELSVVFGCDVEAHFFFLQSPEASEVRSTRFN